MSRYDQQEIENYTFGSPLWAGQNDPVLIEGANDEVFWDSFLGARGGKGFARLDSDENRTTLLQKYRDLHPCEPIVRSVLSSLWYKLMITNNPDFVDPQAEPEDARPRDAAGNLLSAEAVRNQEYLVWMDGKSEFQVRERRVSDKGFATFFTAMNQVQLRSDDQMAEQNYRNNVRTEKANVSQALRDFAAEYQKLPVAECKRRMSPAVSPAGYQEFNRNFEAALSAGLL